MGDLHFHDNSHATRLIASWKRFERQNIALTSGNCKNKCLNVAQKAKKKKAQILLKSQEIAQECWKCKIVLQIPKSAKRNRDMPIWNSNITP